MKIRMLEEPLRALRSLEETARVIRSGKPAAVTGSSDAARGHLIAGLWEMTAEEGKAPRMGLVVTGSDARARELYEDLRALQEKVWLYPARDLLFFSADVHGSALTVQRLAVVRALLSGESGLVVTTPDALLDPLLPLSELSARMILLEQGQKAEIGELREQLLLLGYEYADRVEEPGQFSVRGGILDIFPLTEDAPIRTEFWDDEIDSIRAFDAESQRSIENLSSVWIFPAAELLTSQEERAAGCAAMKKDAEKNAAVLEKGGNREAALRLRTTVRELTEGLTEGWISRVPEGYIRYFRKETVSFLDYFDKKAPVFLDEPARLSESADVVFTEFKEAMEGRLSGGQALPGQAALLRRPEEVFAALSGRGCLLLSGLDKRFDRIKAESVEPIDAPSMPSYRSQFEQLTKDLSRWKQKKYRVLLLSPSRTRAGRLAEDLREYGLSVRLGETGRETVGEGEILVTQGSLRSGFQYPLIRFIVLTEGDLFGQEKKKKRRRPRYEGSRIHDFSELSVGDYVVHENHGLGVYGGIEKVTTHGVTRDYLKITYADKAVLYTPVTQMDLVQKYAAAGAKAPKLSRLGSQEWNRTKTRVRSAVKDIAADLVRLYAARREKKGYPFEKDTVWQKEFEELFPYEETEDQKRAIEETKADMESTKIMDRLICGDVGYGKTEIAIRAAFKAVQESKQVVLLVPTTILAQQHYSTFSQRMKDYPVTVALLSRFQTKAEQTKILDDLKKGFVDILIGTHRVLSKDVVFKDLGLLIVDEEQRFGVAHKEKIKRLKENVDVLTLSATPIPRTLHMSLAGIRDMSVLEEPPQDRVPIQTYVMEYSEETVREAVTRELSRGGQVYYVYNRVKDIEDAAARIQALVPEASVVYAHGQMPERKLEQIMFDFMNGEIDVLVSTTIIETGLDISNVNTIIIHDADRFGLSQLYQLRGRVGRSSRTAYAFLLYRRDKLLKEVAEKRLQAIREYTELGSGIRIAMRDLEIRGAGNVLGAEQHGHMEAVGYDLYCKLLNTAVRALRGGAEEEEDFETTVDLTIDAYIPSSYIRNETLKLEIYKRIAAVSSQEEYEEMQDELIDRFGDMPPVVELLLSVSLLRARAHAADVTEITGGRSGARLTMYRRARLDVARIPELLEKYGESLLFSTAGDPAFTLLGPKGGFESAKALVAALTELAGELSGLRLPPET